MATGEPGYVWAAAVVGLHPEGEACPIRARVRPGRMLGEGQVRVPGDRLWPPDLSELTGLAGGEAGPMTPPVGILEGPSSVCSTISAKPGPGSPNRTAAGAAVQTRRPSGMVPVRRRLHAGAPRDGAPRAGGPMGSKGRAARPARRRPGGSAGSTRSRVVDASAMRREAPAPSARTPPGRPRRTEGLKHSARSTRHTALLPALFGAPSLGAAESPITGARRAVGDLGGTKHGMNIIKNSEVRADVWDRRWIRLPGAPGAARAAPPGGGAPAPIR
ncbi:unnamed protein product, partial [Prorocentrum cordatum]